MSLSSGLNCNTTETETHTQFNGGLTTSSSLTKPNSSRTSLSKSGMLSKFEKHFLNVERTIVFILIVKSAVGQELKCSQMFFFLSKIYSIINSSLLVSVCLLTCRWCLTPDSRISLKASQILLLIHPSMQMLSSPNLIFSSEKSSLCHGVRGELS